MEYLHSHIIAYATGYGLQYFPQQIQFTTKIVEIQYVQVLHTLQYAFDTDAFHRK